MHVCIWTAAVIPTVHARKPESVERQILPALFPLLDVAKTEVRAAVGTALSACSRCIGKAAVLSCAGSLSEEGKTKLKGLIGLS